MVSSSIQFESDVFNKTTTLQICGQVQWYLESDEPGLMGAQQLLTGSSSHASRRQESEPLQVKNASSLQLGTKFIQN